jgi:hypothetical protein
MSTTSYVARRDTVLGWQYVQRQGVDREGQVMVLGPDGQVSGLFQTRGVHEGTCK